MAGASIFACATKVLRDSVLQIVFRFTFIGSALGLGIVCGPEMKLRIQFVWDIDCGPCEACAVQHNSFITSLSLFRTFSLSFSLPPFVFLSVTRFLSLPPSPSLCPLSFYFKQIFLHLTLRTQKEEKTSYFTCTNVDYRMYTTQCNILPLLYCGVNNK